MVSGAVSSNRRHLAVWFPFLPADRWERARPEASGEGPRVFAAKQRSALRLAAVAPAALARGLTRGMTLADARARAPDLIALPHRPEADEALLELLVQAFGRFSPMVARDDPHGLMLDVTGCAHLFGGEEGLVRAARRLADRLGLQARTALARTPQTARALTRFGRGGIVPPGGDPAAAGRLPVAALELPPEATLALRRAGLAMPHRRWRPNQPRSNNG